MKKCLTSLAILLLPSLLLAQPVNRTLNDVVMPSPTAASLGKYGDIPVSYYTGVPSVSIPLYTLSAGPLKLPVSLAYHAGGMKVGEPVSWAGLGWSVQAGGMISRTVQGKADEEAYGYMQNGQTVSVDAAGCVNGTNQNYDFVTNNRDPEPDIFSFAVGGYSGKFFIEADMTNDGLVNGKVVLIPQQDLKVDYTIVPGGTYNLKGFVFTLPDGTRYEYGLLGGEADVTQGCELSTYNNATTGITVSGWFLRRIRSADLNFAINLNYVTEEYRYTYRTSNGAGGYQSWGPYQANSVRVSGLRLSSITTPTTTVSLVAGADRQDVQVDFTATKAKELAAIKIQSGTLCKQFVLTHSYYEDTSSLKSGDSADKRLKLESLQEISCDAALASRPYTFAYYGQAGTPAFLPTRLSAAIDHWGYYNGATANPANSMSTDLNIPTTRLEYTPLTGGGSTVVTHGSANRETNESTMKWGTLQTIAYPTGGSTSFDYEANSYPGSRDSVRADTLGVLSHYWSGGQCNNSTSLAPGAAQTLTLTSADLPNLYYTWNEVKSSVPGCDCISGSPSANLKVIRLSDNVEIGSVWAYANCSSSIVVTGDGKLTSLLANLAANTGVALRFELHGAFSASRFTLRKITTTTLSATFKVGGLRVKTITSSDGLSSANDVVKSYRYDYPSGSGPNAGQSSGVLYSKPVYGYVYDGCVGNCTVPNDPGSGGCPAGSNRLRNYFFFEHSVVPLSSFEGYHIGYSAVREYYSADQSGYYTYYQYKNDPGPLFTGIPIAPPQPRISSGQLFNKGYRNAAGLDLSYESYSPRSEASQVGQGVYLKFTPYTPGKDGSGAQPITFYRRYAISTQPFRYESITHYLDGQATLTTRQYTGANHLQLTKESVTNSDGKQTDTDYKYPADLSSTLPPAQLSAMTALNLLVPLQTTVSVNGILQKGTQTQYAFFDQGTGNFQSTGTGNANWFIRPYQFYAYEGSSWVLKGTINGYEGSSTATGGAGLPNSFTKTGWLAETYTYNQQNQLVKRQFKDFSWQYTYLAGTGMVSRMTNPDGQYSDYSYDKLMRLGQVQSRGGNAKTEYSYNYPTVNGSGLITAPGNVYTKTTFTPVAGSGLSVQETYQYVDGLGRSRQSVARGRATGGKDQVRAVAYDGQGRLAKTYEAFASPYSDGRYQDPGSTPFTLTGYEASALNRTSSVTPPGWFASQTSYGVNSSGDGVLSYDYATGNSSGFSDNLLAKYTVADGNGNKTITFTDKKGRLLLSRRTDGAESTGNRLDTYYVYDDKDRLVRVIPPGAGWSSADLTYGYTYQDNDLVASKQLPGKGPEHYEYNSRDLPVRYQDPFLLANSGRWLGSQYDDYGRLTARGVWASGSGDAISLTNKIVENLYSSQTTGITVDKLSSRKTMLFDVADPVVSPGASNNVVQTSFSYDSYGRISGTGGNSHTNLGNPSAESLSYGYDYGDNILTENRVSNLGSAGSINISNTRLFDSWGRLSQTSQALNGGTPTLISQLSYTDKDQLSGKQLGANLQQVDYAYLANGLLTSINGTSPLGGSTTPVGSMTASLSTPSFGATTDDLFRQELQYNSLTAGLNGTVQQSGNIGQLLWQVKGRTTQAYGLSYDYLDRLTNARYSDYTAAGVITNTEYFTERQSFDSRGNLLTQVRNGLVKASSNYTLKYNLDNPSLSQASGTNQTTLSVGMSSIPASRIPLEVPHNHLNLPSKFDFGSGNSIELLYDGLGNKLRKTVKTAGSVSLTQDYLGGIELKNNAIEAVYNEEGRAFNTGSGYRYEYVLRDHLGNTRLIFTDKDGSGSIDNSEILSESHYYPFGRKMDGAWYSDAGAGKYRYLYNGKELSDEFDLNFYDYGARWYDPGMGSWWQIDPLAEVSRRWSPYVFSNNNPLRFVDVDGRNAADDAAKALQQRVENAQFADRATGTLGYAGLFGGDTPPDIVVNGVAQDTKKVAPLVRIKTNKINRVVNTNLPVPSNDVITRKPIDPIEVDLSEYDNSEFPFDAYMISGGGDVAALGGTGFNFQSVLIVKGNDKGLYFYRPGQPDVNVGAYAAAGFAAGPIKFNYNSRQALLRTAFEGASQGFGISTPYGGFTTVSSYANGQWCTGNCGTLLYSGILASPPGTGVGVGVIYSFSKSVLMNSLSIPFK